MANEKKCGYTQCLCMVSEHEHYCSDYCKDAQGEKEIEIQCDCKHEPCALDQVGIRERGSRRGR